MKNILRAFVIVLTVTGSAAYTQISTSHSKVLTGKTSSCPTPWCPPNDPNACGFR